MEYKLLKESVHFKPHCRCEWALLFMVPESTDVATVDANGHCCSWCRRVLMWPL